MLHREEIMARRTIDMLIAEIRHTRDVLDAEARKQAMAGQFGVPLPSKRKK